MTHCEKFVTECKGEIALFKKGHSFKLLPEQKTILNQAYIELGGKPIRLNCPPCITEAFGRLVHHTEILAKEMDRKSKIEKTANFKKGTNIENFEPTENFITVDDSLTNKQLLLIIKQNGLTEPRNASKANLIKTINEAQIKLK